MKKKSVKEKEVPVKDDDSYPFNVYLFFIIPAIGFVILLLSPAFRRLL